MDLNLFFTGAVVLITHALEAVTGFGCTVIAFPFITALQGIYQAKVMLAVMAWLIGFYIVATKFRDINFKHFFRIVLLMGAGMPVGITLFNALSPESLKICLGIFIIVTSLFQLKKEYLKSATQRVFPQRVYDLILFAGGIVHGAFATGGPFVVLYAADRMKDKGEFRATLSLLWMTLNTILFMTDATFKAFFGQTFDIVLNGGTMTGSVSGILWMVPFLAAGIVIGELVHKRVTAELFRKLIFWVLFATGVFMVAA